MAKGRKTGGRLVGTKNHNSTELKDMIMQALHGAGGRQYLQKQADENPAAFLGLVGKVLPKDMNVNIPQAMIVSLNGKGIGPA